MTFTKEQLIARARFLIRRHEDSLANQPDQDGIAMDLELARMALAGMEAEPVAHLYSASFERGHVEGELTDAPGCDMPVYSAPQPLTTSERTQLESARLHIAELEAAPPAPVGDGETPVPLLPDFPGRTLTQRECYRAGFEAGKALKDGWVACSERMPEDTVDADGGATCYLVLYAEGRQPNGGSNVQVSNVTYLRRWHEGMITHWQPLPAAPQQEAE